jgi:transposase
MTTTKVLEKILLPINDLWRVDDVQIKEEEKSVYVHLSYKLDFAECDGERYPIYDYRHERSWRHLDLWQYKTYLTARIPRYKSGSEIRSVSVGWADTGERITTLLEKKR